MRLLLSSLVVGFLATSASAQVRQPLPRAGQGVPGSNVITPMRTFSPYGGNNYFINNGNATNNSSFGNPSYGFNGMQSSGQFYAIMGGPAPSNPFVNNTNSFRQTWPNGNSAFVQQSKLPFNTYNFTNQQPMPGFMNNAPVVGQANGFFPNQGPVPAAPNNNGPVFQGLNGFGNK